MADILVVGSKVREFIKAEGNCKTGSDLPEALSKYVEQALRAAINRAKANSRKTVRSEDL